MIDEPGIADNITFFLAIVVVPITLILGGGWLVHKGLSRGKIISPANKVALTVLIMAVIYFLVSEFW